MPGKFSFSLSHNLLDDTTEDIAQFVAIQALKQMSVFQEDVARESDGETLEDSDEWALSELARYRTVRRGHFNLQYFVRQTVLDNGFCTVVNFRRTDSHTYTTTWTREAPFSTRTFKRPFTCYQGTYLAIAEAVGAALLYFCF